MRKTYDIIIVGGGVNGGSIAYQLSKRGYHVLVLEKSRIASKSSGAAAGMLAAQTELDQDGPLFQLAKKSRDMFPSLSEELKGTTGIDIELINKGMYKVATSLEQVEEFKKIIDIQLQTGEEAEWHSPEEVLKNEAALSEHLFGAMYIPKDGHVSAYQLSAAFMKAAAVYGAEITENTSVHSFLTNKEKINGVVTDLGEIYCDQVVVTTGAWSRRLLEKTGIEIPVYPVKGECFSVTTNKPLFTRTIFSHGCYIVPKKGGRLIVGATMKPNTFDERVTFDGISTLVERAQKLAPSIIDAEWEKTWAGIRPQTSDGLPYLGSHPQIQGLWIATGHFRNGILLAPVTGELMSDLIQGKQVEANFISGFKIDRETETTISL